MAVTNLYTLDFTTKNGEVLTLEIFQASETPLSSPTVVQMPSAAFPDNDGIDTETGYENVPIGFQQVANVSFTVRLDRLTGSTALDELAAAIVSPIVPLQPTAWAMPYSTHLVGFQDELYTIYASTVWTIEKSGQRIFQGVQRFEPTPELIIKADGTVELEITLVDIRRYTLESTPMGMIHRHCAEAAAPATEQHMVYNHYYRKDSVTYASIFRNRAIDDALAVFFSRENLEDGLFFALQQCYRFLSRNTTAEVDKQNSLWSAQRLFKQPYVLTGGAQIGSVSELANGLVYFQAYLKRNDGTVGWIHYDGMLYPGKGFYQHKNAYDFVNNWANPTGTKIMLNWVAGGGGNKSWNIIFSHPHTFATPPTISAPAWKSNEITVVPGGEYLRGAEIGIDTTGDNNGQFRVEKIGIGDESLASHRLDMHSSPHIPTRENVFYHTPEYDHYGMTAADLSGDRVTVLFHERPINIWVYFDQPEGALKQLPIRCHTWGKYFFDPSNITESAVPVPAPPMADVQTSVPAFGGGYVNVFDNNKLNKNFFEPLRISMLDSQKLNSLPQNYATLLAKKFSFEGQFTVEGESILQLTTDRCGEVFRFPLPHPHLTAPYDNRYVILSLKRELLGGATELKLLSVPENPIDD